MPAVVALYRYPVKGFTPEACRALTVLSQGRIAGDRVLGFRFANSAAADASWSRKHEFVALVNTPALARLDLQFDHRRRWLRIGLDGALLVEAALDDDGRKRLAAVLQRHVLELADNPLSGHPERQPLRLVGDGVTPRYQDNEGGQATLHSRETLAAVAAAFGEPGLDETRFRSNIVIEGVGAWAENGWLGRKVRIGRVAFDVVKQKTRCLATHANPKTGERDLPVMKLLTSRFSQDDPTFAVGMVTSGPGGEIRVGDAVALDSE
jgi:uncharacterized protein YcbX